MAAFTVRLIQALWSGQPSFAEEWPWLIGPLAVGVAGVVLAGRLARADSTTTFTGVGSPAEEPSIDLARRLLKSGRRIQAVQMVQRLTGVSMKEAVAVVESMERESTPE
jgi:ribosomal protein L7/L12